MSFCSAVWYHAVPQGSSIVQMTTGQLAWWRMKSLVLPSIVRRTTPTPRVPVTTNFGFSWVMKSEMACSGLTPTFSTRISTSICLSSASFVYSSVKAAVFFSHLLLYSASRAALMSLANRFSSAWYSITR